MNNRIVGLNRQNCKRAERNNRGWKGTTEGGKEQQRVERKNRGWKGRIAINNNN